MPSVGCVSARLPSRLVPRSGDAAADELLHARRGHPRRINDGRLRSEAELLEVRDGNRPARRPARHRHLNDSRANCIRRQILQLGGRAALPQNIV